MSQSDPDQIEKQDPDPYRQGLDLQHWLQKQGFLGYHNWIICCSVGHIFASVGV